MINKTIIIDNKEINFKASAATPRIYRAKFRKDIMQDMKRLAEALEKNQGEGEEFDVIDLELFENVAYIMAGTPGASAEQWLEGFDMFSIYEVLPEILDLWGMNLETQTESKKKLQTVAGN